MTHWFFAFPWPGLGLVVLTRCVSSRLLLSGKLVMGRIIELRLWA